LEFSNPKRPTTTTTAHHRLQSFDQNLEFFRGAFWSLFMGWILWGSLGLKLGSLLRFEKKMEKKIKEKTSWWFQNHPSEKYSTV